MQSSTLVPTCQMFTIRRENPTEVSYNVNHCSCKLATSRTKVIKAIKMLSSKSTSYIEKQSILRKKSCIAPQKKDEHSQDESKYTYIE